ncbi:class I tRNA ligase family protein [Actinacidiphila acididurans]|uniref:methionine--tRNA ligase n=1 Tax=Actinacidiphila acididurans TaxID=2784346 RepID=A0ABS2TMT6_9ACTN|nr:class I tRNA ligase family protein [Actinacidiphila acididurans]MBM9504112.1 class I tRNA ligase family protein [Actinacidiphila acididurans]
MTTTRPAIITSAPPNPNGDLHLGHLAGPFLGADVLARRLRQAGREVLYVGYSDEHSCYVPRRAEELGITAHDAALLFGNRMEETLSLGAMHHDWFTRPLTDDVHTRTVQRFFLGLWEKGALEVRELPVFHCGTCDRYLYEAEVRGNCQYCGDPSDGVYCEACGLAQDPAGLSDPKCTRCWEPAQTRTLKRIAFPLDDYRERLTGYVAAAGAAAEWRPRLTAYLEGLLAGPLPLTPVSREADYGIPVPLPGWEGHVLDTWFSGIWGYVAGTARLTAAQGHPDHWEELWAGDGTPGGAEEDSGAEIVHFIGFDCSFSHAVLWPALLMAHGGLTLPTQVVINEFYRLEGEKFSTSRDHAIWGGDFLRTVPADVLRFHLCLTGPEREQTNFAMKEFTAVVDDVLVGGLQRWLDRLEALAAEHGGTVPADAPSLAGEGAPGRAVRLLAEAGRALEPAVFSPQAATAAIRDAVQALAADTEGWDAPGAGNGVVLRTHLELLARLAATAAPVMPYFAEKVWRGLGLAWADPVRRIPPLAATGADRVLAPGARLPLGFSELFRPIGAGRA